MKSIVFLLLVAVAAAAAYDELNPPASPLPATTPPPSATPLTATPPTPPTATIVAAAPASTIPILASGWTYDSPSSWDMGTCQGKSQSPINIEHEKAVCIRDGESVAVPYRINFAYIKQANLSVYNDGNFIQVHGDLGYVTLGSCNPCDGQRYNLKQFHFHTPGEHTFDGKAYPLELQLVHQKQGSTGNKDLLIVSVPFYVQAPGGFLNSFLKQLDLTHLPALLASNKLANAIDFDHLAEALLGEFYTYKGSLTFPGCDETVTWYVTKNRLGVTAHQLKHITDLLGNKNARPVQPINGRQVFWYRKRH